MEIPYLGFLFRCYSGPMLRDLGTENVKSTQTLRLEISSSTGTLV
jgi:hypothetical protein